MVQSIKMTDLTPEDAAFYPRPGMNVPGTLSFSPDDRWITYLFSPDQSLTRQLYLFDPQTAEHQAIYITEDGGETEETLSIEEKLRRERTRTRTLGVTQYTWMPGHTRLMIPLNGRLYLVDAVTKKTRLVANSGEYPIVDPRCSPDGSAIAFVRDAELYVIDAESGEQRQLTFGARRTGKVHGLAEYIAQEEMDRQHGFWWSPNNRLIAFTEVDETHIPVFRIIHQGKENTGDSAQEDHRYPFAGKLNAIVRLGIVSADGGDPVWMGLGEDPDMYLARVQWWTDNSLVAQVENRAQKLLKVIRCNPESGQCEQLLEESNSTWINLHSMLKPLRDGRFIWASERNGFMQLYLYDKQGKVIHPLTPDARVVESIVGVDEKHERIYYMGTGNRALERHLFVVPFSGGEPTQLTEERGFHEVRLDHARKCFIDTFSNSETPPQVLLKSLKNGTTLQTLFSQAPSAERRSKLAVPEYVDILTSDGVTLHGMLYRPPSSYGQGPYPTIISVYGGPHVQQVTESWLATVDMRAQYLSQLGYLVFKLDNRGSSRRGQAFEAVIQNRMGDVEVQDQVTGVQWLVAQGLADPSRVGIYGWSYGGYMSLMCLARAPKVFRVAVAGAPVTHWDGYDTHYTERYMETPESNPDGYQSSSVMTHVQAIEGKLLLIHGLIDENVHFRHTARLINALIRAGKTYDLLLFPDERHMPRRLEDRIYLETRIRDFFKENL